MLKAFDFVSQVRQKLKESFIRMDNLTKINSLYRFACLFDGFFDGKHIRYNHNRHLWNSFVGLIMGLVSVSHLVIFITGNELLENNLIYLKFTGGFGSRYLNFGLFNLKFNF